MDRELEAIATPIKALMDVVGLIQRQGQRIKENPRNLTLIAEAAFLQRKADDILNSVRRELDAMSFIAEQTGCLMLAVTEEPKFTCDTATISPSPSVVLGLPKPADPEFSEFIKQLPPCCLRPHYPTIVKECDEAIAKGEQVPYKHVGVKSMELKLRVTSKRDL